MFVTAKVLLYRYVYVLRHRWLLTIAYFLFPLILCLLPVVLNAFVKLEKYESHVVEHDERTLLRLPETENCTSEGRTDCQLKIVIFPDGPTERLLMDRVEGILRLSDNTTALDITYVDHPAHMESILVSSNHSTSRGLIFHQITDTKLDYTMRPFAEFIPSVLYDWGDYATDKKFPSPMYRGPRLTDPYFNVENKIGLGGKINLAGLLPLMVAVDKAYIETFFPNISKDWILASFPHPPYFEVPETLRAILTYRFFLLFVQYLLVVGMTFMSTVCASYIIRDKESGIREWLHLNGAPRWVVNLSWLVSFSFEATLLAILETSILKIPTQNGQTLRYMSSYVLCLVLVVYNFSTLSWVHLSATIQNDIFVCVLTMAAYCSFTPFLQWIPPDHFAMQGALATLPNAGLVLIFMTFQEFDGAETVLDLNLLGWKTVHYLPVSIFLLIMLASSLFLILLSVYMDLVKPGKYGRAKPWYLFKRKEEVAVRGVGKTLQRSVGRYFEQISSMDPIALECVNVSKAFGKHRTVDNINMKILKNQITVLLGNNGAGKTTLLCILCGMHSPTMGHFYTDEYDVFQGDNIEKFRRVMGYCPQYDWLMEELTVKQHFVIFASLKGLSPIEAQESCITWAERFDTVNSLNTKASNLSSGTRRKLCLAIAMIGNPRYLLLDDPFSSLDAKSTRTFWNILLQEKGKCTVIMTTHDMKEADVLGDRIALMDNGQLKGYGTSSFLKKQLKIDYKLYCAVNKKSTRDVIRVVGNLFRSATILYQTNHAVTFAMPIGLDLSSLMATLESELGDDVTISLSFMSMDDVLTKVQADIASVRTSLAGPQKVPAGYLELSKISDSRRSTLTDRPSWICGQVKEIFMKKVKWTCNRKTSLISILVIPILCVVLTMYSISETVGDSSSHEHLDKVSLTLDSYSGKRAFVASRKNAIAKTMRLALKDGGIRYNEVHEDMVDYLNGRAKKNRFSYRSQMVFAFDSGDENSDSPRAFYSRNAFHSAPIAYSALMNSIIPGTASITAHNHPIAGERKGPSCYGLNPTLITLLFSIVIGPILLIVSSYFITFPYIERQSLFKHLQLMTGLLPSIYWISNLMCDFLIFTFTSLLMISTLVIMDIGLFLNPTVIKVLIGVSLLYGISAILFAYTCSFCRCSISTILIVFIIIHPLLLIGFLVLKVASTISFGFTLSNKSLYFLPWMILMESLQKITTWAVESIACLQCRKRQSCEFILKHSLIPSLKNELLSFVIVSLVYFAFIIAMDHGFGRKLKPMVERMFYGTIKNDQDAIDPALAREKSTVKDLEMEEEEYRSELICDGLGKKYSSKVTAVRDVTFVADRGEMFCILGANGAGKSTTFGMVSGLISPTKGLAIVRGKWELGDCEYKYIRNFGYCPQFYGFLPGFSGRNTLRLFGRLRGFKPSILDSHVDFWLQVLDMEAIAHQHCEFYSEGNKRKLSFAIAMIGNPPIVLLDDPTTSIDPVIRKRIWDILLTSLRKRSQTVILTSHTMSECEAICDRLTIMVDGELKTLGSVSTLKNKYGNTCILLVKLKRNTTKKQIQEIRSKILAESRFSRYAQLKEERPNLLNISVNTRAVKTYKVFADMLMIKEQISAIEDFRLIETTLEEVIRKHAEENKTKVVKRSQTKKRHPKGTR